MKKTANALIAATALSACFMLGAAQPAHAKDPNGIRPSVDTNVPKALTVQIKRLNDLLQDKYAEASTDKAMVQLVKPNKEDQVLALVVWGIGGSGGGTNYIQYFAVFKKDFAVFDLTGMNGGEHFTLVDVMPINYRYAVDKLHAKVTENPANGETLIAFEAAMDRDMHDANAVDKKVTLHLLLKNDRLFWQEK